jgi:hypothetical protein
MGQWETRMDIYGEKWENEKPTLLFRARLEIKRLNWGLCNTLRVRI